MNRHIRLDTFLIIFSSLSWISLTILTLKLTSPKWKEPLGDFFHGDIVLAENIFLSLFFVSIYLFFNDFTKRISTHKKLEWTVKAINIVCLFLHILILFLEHFNIPPISLSIWLNFLNNFNILIGTVFSANCFFYFKSLIMYERNPIVTKLWGVFEWMIYASILLTIFNVNILEPIVAFVLIIYSSVALYLSTKMRWVAFLSKKSKIKMIGTFLLYLFMLCLILQNFFFESFTFGVNANYNLLVIDCAHKFFLLSTFVFVLFYLTSSILILLFNLPTSLAFEEKSKLAENYKKLSFTLSNHKGIKEIYTILEEISVSSSKVESVYTTNKNDYGKTSIISYKGMNETLAQEVEQFLDLRNPFRNQQIYNPKAYKNAKRNSLIAENRISSILSTPLLIQEVVIGHLVLVSKVEDAIDPEILEVITSYCSQACLSVENIKLFDKTIQNERYLEEIKIAEKVKEKLLPKTLDFGNGIKSSLYTHSSDTIGGDYYEALFLEEGKTVFALGDVSGNGTSAAFNMAQLKGIFQTTIQNIADFSKYPKVFNAALLSCLEQNSFVSISFFMIDTNSRTIRHFRCGHLPSFIVNAEQITTLNPKGIGLGMISNDRLGELIEEVKLTYQKGDVLFCYTDGLIETTNEDKVQYGTTILKKILQENCSESTQKNLDCIIDSFNKFIGTTPLSVDITCICIKLP